MLHGKRQCWRHWSLPANVCFMWKHNKRFVSWPLQVIKLWLIRGLIKGKTGLSVQRACSLTIELVWSTLCETWTCLTAYKSQAFALQTIACIFFFITVLFLTFNVHVHFLGPVTYTFIRFVKETVYSIWKYFW